jgi:hypothetical protein
MFRKKDGGVSVVTKNRSAIETFFLQPHMPNSATRNIIMEKGINGKLKVSGGQALCR